jgi:hypothetical protein
LIPIEGIVSSGSKNRSRGMSFRQLRMVTQPFSECVKRDTMQGTLQSLVEKPAPRSRNAMDAAYRPKPT